jgi:hypothetical protein
MLPQHHAQVSAPPLPKSLADFPAPGRKSN